MDVIDHPLRREHDWWEIRDFLVAMFSVAPPGHVWEVRRWDGMRFHEPAAWAPERFAQTRVWRAGGGIVGVATQEGSRDVAIQIHPDWRFLESRMLDWAEEHLAAESDGIRALEVPVFDYDIPRRRVLSARGYEPLDDGEVVRRMRIGDAPRPRGAVADGYRLTTGLPEIEDCEAFARLLNESFGRTSHRGTDVRTFRTQSPSYEADLDLMAVARDGTFAASAGVTIDGVNRAGIFEPVLTHPDHRRRGLARELMREGLHRMQQRGVETAWVGTGLKLEANALYDVVGFTELYTGRTWRKVF